MLGRASIFDKGYIPNEMIEEESMLVIYGEDKNKEFGGKSNIII